MSRLSFSIGQLTISPLFWSLFLAAFLSSFSLWRKLKEDFEEEEIFSLTLLVLIVCFLGGWLWQKLVFFVYLSFWLGVGVIKLWAVKFKKNVWEILDGFAWWNLFFLFFGGLGLFLESDGLGNLGLCLAGLLGFLFYAFFQKKYRSFGWYKSGKTGFLFWGTNFVVFSVLLLLAFLQKGSLYWDRLVLGATALICFGCLYYRSGRNLVEDLRIKWQK